MNMRILFFAILIFCGTALKALDANISYASFKSPQNSYVEIYFYISGASLKYLPVKDSLQQSAVDVLVMFKQGEKVVKFDKFVLHSPLDVERLNFSDIQRYALPDGTYDLVIELTDQNDAKNIKKYNSTITLDFPEGALKQSDIQLLASVEKNDDPSNPFVKNGLFMEMLPGNFYTRYSGKLWFYNEIYHSDDVIGEDFILTCVVTRKEGDTEQTEILVNKRKHPEAILPVLMQLDISELRSGTYTLKVEIKDRNKGLLSQRSIEFQRSNPFLDAQDIALEEVSLDGEFVSELSDEQLRYSLLAMTPILPPLDVEVVNLMLKEENFQAQRMYLFSFWAKKDPINPKQAYGDFINVAAAVDKTFRSGFRYGFETDRGYTFLKYGRPNDIVRVETEQSAPPYEIWSYYEFPQTGQRNVHFLFYNPSLAAEDFIILHSTALGEFNNPNWERDLYRDAPNEIEGTDYFGGTGVQDNFNRRAKRILEDF
jgi:GWxTD domain-containing protein